MLDGKPTRVSTAPVKGLGRTGPPPGRGVGRLLNGGETAPVAVLPDRTQDVSVPPPSTATGLPKWPFFLADGLLLGFVGLLIWNSDRPLSTGMVLTGALGIIAGAVIALLPFGWKAQQKPAVRPPQRSPVRLRVYLQ